MRKPTRDPPRRVLLPVALLLVASIVYRLPPLLNAPLVNSDVAVVGLQAIHILRGQWSWFLFGSGYQTSVDSLIAALFFGAAGAGPLVLMLSALCGYVALTLFAFFTLRRHLPPWTAFLTVLPLVFTPPAVHTYALHPPRQAALTLVFVSIWLLDRASSAARPLAHYALGTAVAFFAYFADPYALVFLPALIVFAALATRDGGPDKTTGRHRVLASAVGVVLGAIPVTLLRMSRNATPGQTRLRFGLIRHNAHLLFHPCLPWALSEHAYWDPRFAGYLLWKPGAFGVVQKLGALCLVFSFAFALAAFWMKRIPWRIRRIGLLGALIFVFTIGGFLTSVMVMDLFSMRYLAAIVLAAPLALAPLAHLVHRRTLTLALLPYLASAAVCGWVGYAPCIQGLEIRDLRAGRNAARLESELEASGVDYAIADYWSSYRLTFLSREHFVVVPLHASQDRYAPYRRAFELARRYAYIFDARRSSEDFALTERRLPGKRLEELRVGAFRAVVFQRAGAATDKFRQTRRL